MGFVDRLACLWRGFGIVRRLEILSTPHHAIIKNDGQVQSFEQ